MTLTCARRVRSAERSARAHTIRNGRPVQDEFVLDVHGCASSDAAGAVVDFTGKAEVEAVHEPEVLAFVNEQLDANASRPSSGSHVRSSARSPSRVPARLDAGSGRTIWGPRS